MPLTKSMFSYKHIHTVFAVYLFFIILIRAYKHEQIGYTPHMTQTKVQLSDITRTIKAMHLGLINSLGQISFSWLSV